jgi:hypothetical protein
MDEIHERNVHVKAIHGTNYFGNVKVLNEDLGDGYRFRVMNECQSQVLKFTIKYESQASKKELLINIIPNLGSILITTTVDSVVNYLNRLTEVFNCIYEIDLEEKLITFTLSVIDRVPANTCYFECGGERILSFNVNNLNVRSGNINVDGTCSASIVKTDNLNAKLWNASKGVVGDLQSDAIYAKNIKVYSSERGEFVPVLTTVGTPNSLATQEWVVNLIKNEEKNTYTGSDNEVKIDNRSALTRDSCSYSNASKIFHVAHKGNAIGVEFRLDDEHFIVKELTQGYSTTSANGVKCTVEAFSDTSIDIKIDSEVIYSSGKCNVIYESESLNVKTIVENAVNEIISTVKHYDKKSTASTSAYMCNTHGFTWYTSGEGTVICIAPELFEALDDERTKLNITYSGTTVSAHPKLSIGVNLNLVLMKETALKASTRGVLGAYNIELNVPASSVELVVCCSKYSEVGHSHADTYAAKFHTHKEYATLIDIKNELEKLNIEATAGGNGGGRTPIITSVDSKITLKNGKSVIELPREAQYMCTMTVITKEGVEREYKWRELAITSNQKFDGAFVEYRENDTLVFTSNEVISHASIKYFREPEIYMSLVACDRRLRNVELKLNNLLEQVESIKAMTISHHEVLIKLLE